MSRLRQLVELHYENQANGTVERESEVFTEDVVTVINGGPELHGLDEFLAQAGGFRRAFPDARFSIRSTVESEGTIVVEGIYRGTQSGPFATPGGEVPPTGKSVSVVFADVFELKGDRFGAHRVYFDAMGMMTQLGLLPGAPQ